MEDDFKDAEVVGQIYIGDLPADYRYRKFEELFRVFLAKAGWPWASIESPSGATFTGYKSRIEKGGLIITYLVVEPKKNPEQVALILRTEKNANEGSALDVFQHKVKNPSPQGFNTPFASLLKKEEDQEPGPCDHPGCMGHTTHPCEGCGRTWEKMDNALWKEKEVKHDKKR
jgi:hypothetical protein